MEEFIKKYDNEDNKNKDKKKEKKKKKKIEKGEGEGEKKEKNYFLSILAKIDFKNFDLENGAFLEIIEDTKDGYYRTKELDFLIEKYIPCFLGKVDLVFSEDKEHILELRYYIKKKSQYIV